jgi:hypothetical protein
MKLLAMATFVFLLLVRKYCTFFPLHLVCFREQRRVGAPQDELGRMPKYREQETPVSRSLYFFFLETGFLLHGNYQGWKLVHSATVLCVCCTVASRFLVNILMSF